jgi:hypothetical protein
MPPVELEPAIIESKRPQTHTFDRVATGIGGVPQMQNETNISGAEYLNCAYFDRLS